MRFWRMILLCLFGSHGKSKIDSISNTLFSFSKWFQTVIFNPFFFWCSLYTSCAHKLRPPFIQRFSINFFSYIHNFILSINENLCMIIFLLTYFWKIMVNSTIL